MGSVCASDPHVLNRGGLGVVSPADQLIAMTGRREFGRNRRCLIPTIGGPVDQTQANVSPRDPDVKSRELGAANTLQLSRPERKEAGDRSIVRRHSDPHGSRSALLER